MYFFHFSVFKEKMFFMPNNLKVKFSIVDSNEPPQMPKFCDTYLDGYYVSIVIFF